MKQLSPRPGPSDDADDPTPAEWLGKEDSSFDLIEGRIALEEAIPALRRFWEDEGPKPAHRIGIWTGAYGPRMLRITGRLADGWLPIYFSPRVADMYHGWLDEGFAREGARRTRDTFEIAATTQLIVTDGKKLYFYDKDLKQVTIRAAGFFALIPAFGIMGAVTATTISFVFMAAMLRHSSKSLTGIDGSVLRLLGANQRRAYAAPAE